MATGHTRWVIVGLVSCLHTRRLLRLHFAQWNWREYWNLEFWPWKMHSRIQCVRSLCSLVYAFAMGVKTSMSLISTIFRSLIGGSCTSPQRSLGYGDRKLLSVCSSYVLVWFCIHYDQESYHVSPVVIICHEGCFLWDGLCRWEQSLWYGFLLFLACRNTYYTLTPAGGRKFLYRIVKTLSCVPYV